jgi:heparin/heparan-sulfate lyase
MIKTKLKLEGYSMSTFKKLWLFLFLMFAVAVGSAGENLFKNADWSQWKGTRAVGWNVMSEKERLPDGVLKLFLKRNRKTFWDNGVGQTFQKPEPGFYKVGIDAKGTGFTSVVFWIQIRMPDGKSVYRTQTHAVKAYIPDWKSFSYVFDIPEGAVSAYVQCTARTEKKDQNAVIWFTRPLFRKALPEEKQTARKAEPQTVSKTVSAPQVGKYLRQVVPCIPKNHPRLFCSEAFLAELKRQVLSGKHQEYIEKLKYRVEKQYDTLLKYYKTDNGLGPKEPAGRRYHPLSEWGKTAGSAAILYRLTGEKKWADMAIDLLKKLTPWYNQRFKMERAVSWYGFSRVLALLAWDWLYDEMTPEDRDAIAKEMVAHCKWLTDQKFIRMMCPKGEGLNGPGSGFYSAQCMVPWYAGIVYRGEGYDDAFFAKQLETGLAGHLAMLANRNGMAGDDGGSVNSTPAYCYGTYNNVEFWFFLSWKALTGKNISDDFPGMGLFPFWLNYTLFRGIDGNLYDFGSGSAWHVHNVFQIQTVYHALFGNFYNGAVCDLSDDLMAQRRWVKGNWTLCDHMLNASPFYPIFNRFDLKKYRRNEKLYSSLPKGYFFEQLGQVYMHSGWTGKDTHALFTCGAKSASHKEYDENHFTIYKGGFLALDSGTRTFDFTSKGRELYYAHDNNYRSQSIAHNVVLIRMEGEKFRGWRIDPKDIINHEGMNKTTGGVVRAYETNPDFTYVAGDSTACYNPDKARQVVRQFLMVYPDVFVIYDTVKSVKADQKKTWLLHTQEEPVIKGDTFEAVQKEGRLICRTLLPAGASLEKIGGPGKEFWSDGKNFHPGEYLKKNLADSRKLGYDAPLWGHWRMEIRNPKAVADETFLHVIQVGLKKDFQKMIGTKLIREGNMDGVSFRYNDVDYTITFDRTKVPAGHIKAVKNGKVLHDRAFSGKVQPQRAADYLK